MAKQTFPTDFSHPRYKRVISFFVSKGLLYARGEAQRNYSGKMKIADVLWVGRHLEPRVLSVLPAAILHFPSAFLAQEKVPKDLAVVLEAIRAGKSTVPDFREIPGEELRRWANQALQDKRVKPVDEKRKLKTFRFPPATIKAIKEGARRNGMTETGFIEFLIKSYGRTGHSGDVSVHGRNRSYSRSL